MSLVPLDVGLVPEGTAHDDARPLLEVDALVFEDGDLVAEQRNPRPLADEILVVLVLGVDEHRDARRDELRSGRRDDELLSRWGFASDLEGDVVEVTVALCVFHLHLRDGRLTLGTPDRRRLPAVLPAPVVEVQKRQLGDPLDPRLDRLVRVFPVDRAPERLHLLGEVRLVLRTDLPAELLELPALVVLVADVEFGHRETLARDPVVVVSEREEHLAVVHPLESRTEVLEGETVEVTDVEIARHRRWRCVDRVHRVRVGLGAAIVGVGVCLHPSPLPLRLDLARFVAPLEGGGARFGGPVVFFGFFVGFGCVHTHALTARSGRRPCRVVGPQCVSYIADLGLAR